MSADAIFALTWGVVGGLVTIGWIAAVGFDYQRGGTKLDVKDSGDALVASFAGVMAGALAPMLVCAAVLSMPFLAGRGLAMLAERRERRRIRERTEEKEALRRARDAFDRSEPEWGLLNAALQEATS